MSTAKEYCRDAGTWLVDHSGDRDDAGKGTILVTAPGEEKARRLVGIVGEFRSLEDDFGGGNRGEKRYREEVRITLTEEVHRSASVVVTSIDEIPFSILEAVRRTSLWELTLTRRKLRAVQRSGSERGT